MAAKKTTGARSAATVTRGIRAALTAEDAAAGTERRDSRSLAVFVLFAVLIHAALALALFLARFPLPSVAWRAVDIDLVSAAPSPAPAPPAGIVPYPAAAPAVRAATGTPPFQHAAESSPAAAPRGSVPGGAPGSDAQVGAAAPADANWETMSPGNDRPPVFVVRPEMPAWVDQKGVALAVTVTFTVSPRGIVSGVRVTSSSGFPDIDAAVSEAVMLWHFSSDPSAGTVSSAVRYVVKGREPR